LRDVLDQLAPDKDVIGRQGFKLEDGQKQPTMRQKARFILSARGQPENAIEAPEHTVSLIEEIVSKLARSVYVRSSISAHVPAARHEVQRMKMYLDTVLAELLAIHP
jgi:hypothetical protein